MNALVVFGRSPDTGSGKSRLRPLLGSGRVDLLYSAFLEDILGWELPPATTIFVALTAEPNGLTRMAPDATFLVQPAEAFGDRISAAVDSVFAAGAARAVIVGTDSPTLPAVTLAACFDRLSEHRATLVPAADGGWVAMGVDAALDGSLAGVTWSSAQTCDATRAALHRAGRSPLLLDPWYDVDDAAGLARLRREVRSETGSARAPRTARVLALSP
ncbi:MAG: DUF2064 domain-containing protein [Candidatus Dormibacteraeota bacterium]|nr:DUF2064 domain-containing protein [Candidatus Dormibacteraeota bacterium]